MRVKKKNLSSGNFISNRQQATSDVEFTVSVGGPEFYFYIEYDINRQNIKKIKIGDLFYGLPYEEQKELLFNLFNEWKFLDFDNT